MKEAGRPACELCKARAAVHCEADSAFLCWACDARVHGANFLVSRHLRRVACARCGSLASGRLLSGAGGGDLPIRSSLCLSCAPADGGAPASSSSSSSPPSSCVSTADSPEKEASPEKKRIGSLAAGRRAAADERVQGVLVNWGRRMGLKGGRGRRCASLATHVMRACGGGMAVLPYRVGLAAAMWFAVRRRRRASGGDDEEAMRRLEACSGVPADLIRFTETRLARVLEDEDR